MDDWEVRLRAESSRADRAEREVERLKRAVRNLERQLEEAEHHAAATWVVEPEGSVQSKQDFRQVVRGLLNSVAMEGSGAPRTREEATSLAPPPPPQTASRSDGSGTPVGPSRPSKRDDAVEPEESSADSETPWWEREWEQRETVEAKQSPTPSVSAVVEEHETIPPQPQPEIVATEPWPEKEELAIDPLPESGDVDAKIWSSPDEDDSPASRSEADAASASEQEESKRRWWSNRG